jgi:phage FluMu protein Com
MGAWGYEELRRHVGHKIVCVMYGEENVAIECEDCGEVLIDFDKDDNRPRCSRCGDVNDTFSYSDAGTCKKCQEDLNKFWAEWDKKKNDKHRQEDKKD